MAEIEPSQLVLRNFGDPGSEMQFSVFYISYNLFKLDAEANSSYNLTSNDYEFTAEDFFVKFIIQGILLSIICVMGMLGNACSVTVLMHQRMKSSISCFLIGLAICDILILLTALIMLGIPTCLSLEFLNPGQTSIYLLMGYVGPILYGISTTSLTGSICFTLAVSFERYLVVCHPFMSRRICTWRRACQSSVLIFCIVIVYNLPRWFEYYCEIVYDKNGKEIGCNVKTTELRRNPLYNYYYIFVLYGFTHFFFAISFLIVLNLLIYLRIRKANNKRRALSRTEEKENSLTYMLFVVVVVFIASNIIFGTAIIYKIFNWDTPLTLLSSPIIVGCVGIFLIVFNSSLNFLIYCIYGEKFRETFFHLVSQPWRRLTRNRSDSDFSQRSKCSVTSWSRTVTKTQSVKTICDTVLNQA